MFSSSAAVALLFSSNTIYIVITCFILTLILIANELDLKKKLNIMREQKQCVLLIDENNNNNNNSNINNGESKQALKEAPGPKPKFIVGNLDVLDGYEIPYQAFSVLAEQYGKIIKLKLGSVPSMVVNGVENIREVLVYKGHHFDSRPNFRRYHMLFSGNKENCKYFSLFLFTNRPADRRPSSSAPICSEAKFLLIIYFSLSFLLFPFN